MTPPVARSFPSHSRAGVSNTSPVFEGCVNYFTHRRVEPEFPADPRSLGLAHQGALDPMGYSRLKGADEDEPRAIHLRNRLEGRPGDPDTVRRSWSVAKSGAF